MRYPAAIAITDTHLSESTIEANLNIFTQVFDLCENLSINTIIHCGDIFTSRKGQSEIVLNTFKNILDEAKIRQLKIIAIPGNHDKTDYTKASSFLNVFEEHPAFRLMSPLGFFVFGSTVLFMLPYYDEKITYSKFLSEIVTTATADKGKVKLLFTHVAIDGVSNNGGVVVEGEVNPDVFDVFDRVFVGHYHNRQIINEKIVYIGSTDSRNFGEDSNKGCAVIYDDGSYEFVNLDFPHHTTIEALVEDIDEEMIDRLAKSAIDLNIKLRIGGVLTEEKKPFVERLKAMGVKIELIREDYKPIDVIQSESLQIAGSDIITLFKQWCKKKKINDKFGETLLRSKL